MLHRFGKPILSDSFHIGQCKIKCNSRTPSSILRGRIRCCRCVGWRCRRSCWGRGRAAGWGRRRWTRTRGRAGTAWKWYSIWVDLSGSMMPQATSIRPKLIKCCHNERMVGTQSQCRSRNFHKSVIYLSHNCQKTVSSKNVSGKWQKTVRKLTEICQLQNSVRNLSDKIWKFIKNVSEIIVLSENCQWVFWKTVRKMSEILEMTYFRQIYGQDMKLSGQLNSSKLNKEQNRDSNIN